MALSMVSLISSGSTTYEPLLFTASVIGLNRVVKGCSCAPQAISLRHSTDEVPISESSNFNAPLCMALSMVSLISSGSTTYEPLLFTASVIGIHCRRDDVFLETRVILKTPGELLQLNISANEDIAI
jgi:hypothetical protein